MCLIDSRYKNDQQNNRILFDNEKNIFYLFDYYFSNKLNIESLKFFKENVFKKTISHDYEEFKRISKYSKFFRIRFIGYMGTNGIAAFMITDENEKRFKIVKAIDNFSICKKCGFIGTLFKLNKKSKNMRCGGCLMLPGIKNPF